MKETIVHFKNGRDVIWKEDEFEHWTWFTGKETLEMYGKREHGCEQYPILAIYKLDSLIGVEDREVVTSD